MKKEQDAAYKDVVAALQELNSLRTFRNIGTPERECLDKAVLILEELSWKIVSDDIGKFAERMGAASQDLAALSGRINKTYKHLRTAAAVLRKAAEAVGRAAGIAGSVV
jgi:hypothetical protein